MVDEWVETLVAEGARPQTVKLRRYHVERLERELRLPLGSVTEADLVAYLASKDWAPETRKSTRSSFRAFFSWATERGYFEVDPAARLKKVVVPAGKPKPAPEAILEAALAKASPIERAILVLAAYGGLRRAEIAGLRAEDVTEYGLRVTGKGGRTRIVPIHPKVAVVLEERIDAVGGTGWLFPSPVKKGEPVTPDFVYRHVRALTESYSPHTFRHRFATKAYEGTNDIRAVQDLLGHSSPITTMRYTLVGADKLSAAVLSVA